MSTHDYSIANQNGANTRSDLNNALAAIVSNNSSATAPSTTYAFMWWADTANDLLKQRNAADSAWIDILTLSTGEPITVGTLKYSGSTKLATTSTGIDVTGRITTDGITEDTSGNVGIGVTPENWDSTYTALEIGNHAIMARTGGDDTYTMSNAYYDGNWKYKTSDPATLVNTNNGKHAFSVAPSGTADSAISWSPALTIGNNSTATFTAQAGNASVAIDGGSTNGYYNLELRNNSNNNYAVAFKSGGSIVGSITTFSNATQYNTSSDYRLKENVEPMTGSIDRLKELKPSRFNFIADATTTVDGFLAHEVSDIVPEAITGEKDATKEEEYEVTPAVLDDDGNVVTEAVMGTRTVPDYQGIDQSKLTPLLTSALQEAIEKIESLEARIDALENA